MTSWRSSSEAAVSGSIERSKLEEFIAPAYEETERELQARRDSGEGVSADLDYRQEEGGEG